MKNIFTLCLMFSVMLLNAQTLEEKVSDLSTKIAYDLNKKGAIEIAVYPFSYLKENEQDLAMDIRFDVHEKLEQKGVKYQVMDRGTFDTYAKEHQLNSEGLIDKATAKKFGKLIAADAYVTGKVYMFGSVIRIRIKVTDTETGEILSMQSEKLPIDYDMAQFLGIKDWEKKREKAEENKSQNTNCETENVGDYCFLNNTNSIYEIHLLQSLGGGFNTTFKKLILMPLVKSCFKDLKRGTYAYEFKRKGERVGLATKFYTEFKGEFTVKTCESRIQKVNPNAGENNR